MVNGYKHHQVRHRHQQKSILLPMLCSRDTIKDVKIQSFSKTNDPLSPRISCVGQIKRSNKINGLPNPTTTNHKLINTAGAATATATAPDCTKLRRLFSCKNMISSSVAVPSSTCRKRRDLIKNGENHDSKVEDGKINILEMDPPLPVVKRDPKQSEIGESLWKRRAAGATALKSLQLSSLNVDQVKPTTV